MAIVDGVRANVGPVVFPGGCDETGQPVGVGHASFVVADGKAYTIEQRRGQEVVAAYDINTGRELWTQKWNASYTDSTGDGPRATPTWDN